MTAIDGITSLRHALWRWGGVAIAVSTVAVVAVLVSVDPEAYGVMFAFMGYLATGGLLLAQIPGNRVGWWLLAVGLFFLLGSSLDSPLAEHIPVALEALLTPLSLMGFVSLIVVVTIFPDGVVRTRGQRVILWIIAILAIGAAINTVTYNDALSSDRANPFAIHALEGLNRWIYDHGFFCVPLLLVCALLNIGWRWRRSSGIERQQYRWLVCACAVMVAAVLLLVTNDFATGAVVVFFIAFNALPVAVAIAVTRYRLFDLDRLLTRTASYAIVTALLVGAYALVVTAATRLLPNADTLAVTTATLTAAALARPTYRRFQALVDRHFNRARYNARQTVDEFGLRLRSQIDTDVVRGDLVDAVHRALEPRDVKLWLKS